MAIKYRIRKPPEYKVQAREVVRVLNDRPHLLVRMEVSGETFPHRAPHAFVMIKQDEEVYYQDLFTEVSPENQKLLGYLPVNIPPNGQVVFGYGDEIWGVVPGRFTPASVSRLEREKLPADLQVVDHAFMNDKG